MWFFKSIKFRLTLWYLLVIGALLVLFSGAAYFFLSFQLHKNLDDSLVTSAMEIESLSKFEQGQFALPSQATGLVLVYDTDGNLMASLGPEVEFSEIHRLVDLALLGKDSFQTVATGEGQLVRFYATPFTAATNTRVVVVTGEPPTDIQSVLGTLRSILGLSVLAAVVLAAVGGSILASRAFYPVRSMTGIAKDIGESSLNRRIEVHSQDELGRLASTLNSMIERLESAFKRERQFAADASHELRTPLSVILAESTLALEKERPPEEYRKSLQVITQEAGYMTAMLSNLLLMVRAEAGKEPFNFETVNIRDVLAELASDVSVLAREKGLEFKVDVADDLFVEGDRLKLRQLCLNIIENAIRYTTAGNVAVSAAAKNGTAVVSVTDTGIGIAAEQIPLIFERFYRVDKERSRAQGGAGLGLGIARYIAEAHGGEIEVESTVGKGSTFRILLPLRKDNTPSPDRLDED